MEFTTKMPAVSHQHGRWGPSRMRGVEGPSNRNAIWNIIEVDDDENDVGMGGVDSKPSYPSASSMIQNSFIKPKGVSMIRKGNHLFPAKQSSQTLNSSGLRRNVSTRSVSTRNSSTSKYSYKMRNILQTDLKMGGEISPTSSRIQATTTPKQPRPVTGLTTSVSGTSSHRRKIRKTGSLQDAFSQDIQSLLQSLHSIDFVGTIHPQHHARYISDESLKPL